jgi:adenine/guanine phosphoribosyltransferase-like PRPP-binding protein
VRLEEHIEDIPDFPKPGIVFKDITPLFLDREALQFAIRELSDYARARSVDYVVSAEARGFVLGTAGALCGLVEQAGGVVAGCAFVIELAFLGGRKRLSRYDVRSLVVYDSE